MGLKNVLLLGQRLLIFETGTNAQKAFESWHTMKLVVFKSCLNRSIGVCKTR